jgi:hypothetical protein
MTELKVIPQPQEVDFEDLVKRVTESVKQELVENKQTNTQPVHDTHPDAPETDIELMVCYWTQFHPINLEIRRRRPVWDAGHIDTIELDKNEAITREDLREIHGGGTIKYVLWGPKHRYLGCVTEQYAGPPMRDGEIVRPDKTDGEKNKEKELLKIIFEMQAQNVNAQKEAMDRQMAMMQASFNDRLALEKEMRKDLKAVAQSQQNADTLSDLLENIDTLDSVREKLGGGGTGGESTFAPLLMMAQSLFEKQMQQSQQQQFVETPLPPRKPTKQAKHAAKPQSNPQLSILSQLMNEIESLPEDEQQALMNAVSGDPSKQTDHSKIKSGRIDQG